MDVKLGVFFLFVVFVVEFSSTVVLLCDVVVMVVFGIIYKKIFKVVGLFFFVPDPVDGRWRRGCKQGKKH